MKYYEIIITNEVGENERLIVRAENEKEASERLARIRTHSIDKVEIKELVKDNFY